MRIKENCNFRGQSNRNQIKTCSKLYFALSYTQYKHIMQMMHVRMEHSSGRSTINRNSFLAPRSWASALRLEKRAKLGRHERPFWLQAPGKYTGAVFNTRPQKQKPPGVRGSQEHYQAVREVHAGRTQAEQPHYPCSCLAYPARCLQCTAMHSKARKGQTAHLLH